MIHKKIITQRECSPDGQSIAEAQSITISSGDSNSKILQTITVKISFGNSSSSSSSSSRAVLS